MLLWFRLLSVECGRSWSSKSHTFTLMFYSPVVVLLVGRLLTVLWLMVRIVVLGLMGEPVNQIVNHFPYLISLYFFYPTSTKHLRSACDGLWTCLSSSSWLVEWVFPLLPRPLLSVWLAARVCHFSLEDTWARPLWSSSSSFWLLSLSIICSFLFPNYGRARGYPRRLTPLKKSTNLYSHLLSRVIKGS